MRGEKLAAPMLYIPSAERLELIGIEELFASGCIEEQRIAIDALIAVARKLSEGPLIRKHKNAHISTEHHIYGGPENSQQIADDRVSRRFYVDKRNVTRIRRDVHDWWEEDYGWPILPPRLDMAYFNLETESNLSPKDRKACENVIRANEN